MTLDIIRIALDISARWAILTELISLTCFNRSFVSVMLKLLSTEITIRKLGIAAKPTLICALIVNVDNVILSTEKMLFCCICSRQKLLTKIVFQCFPIEALNRKVAKYFLMVNANLMQIKRNDS